MACNKNFGFCPARFGERVDFSSPPVVAAACNPPAMALQLFYVGMEATKRVDWLYVCV